MTRRLVTSFAFLLLAGSVAVSAAQMQTTPKFQPGKHYVIEVQGATLYRLDPGQQQPTVVPMKALAKESLTPGDRVRVFDSFSDAIFAATNGWVHLSADATPADMPKDAFTAAASTTIIAIDYDYTSYGGSSLTWVVDNSHGCNTYSCGFLNLSTCWMHYYNSALGSDWNDRISSTSGGGGCYRNVLWEDQNYAGSSRECNSSCSSLGVMDNAASSRKWCRSGDSFCNNN